ncbi:MAG: hypothetical protein OXG82_07915 [Gammaproteobacteria bacterium]|nr:hypothetical protein [Gammaproteobacteria bacterium]
MQVDKLIQDQVFSPALIATELRTTRRELAGTLGLAKDAFTHRSQVRLRQLVEILSRVEPRVHSPIAAYTWYRSARLPRFAGATPALLVRDGKSEHVHAYLDRVALGGYA